MAPRLQSPTARRLPSPWRRSRRGNPHHGERDVHHSRVTRGARDFGAYLAALGQAEAGAEADRQGEGRALRLTPPGTRPCGQGAEESGLVAATDPRADRVT